MKRVLSILLAVLFLFPSLCAYADGFTLPSGLQSIGEEAFMDDTAIGDVELPEGVTTIEDGAFRNSSVTSINLPESLREIGENVFEGVRSIIIKVRKYTLPYRWAMANGLGGSILRDFLTVVDLAEIGTPDQFYFDGEVKEEENPDERMACNIYSDPELSGTSGRFTAFSIDFLTENTAERTYWSLCNWTMDLSDLTNSGNRIINDELKANDPEADIGGAGDAYAGLQNKGYDGDTTVSIIAFWDTFYEDSSGNQHVLKPHRVFPVGEEQRFYGEGTGSNHVSSFPFEPNHWYRMLIRCVETPFGKTLVEEWFMDLDTQEPEWTLRTCFDTGLRHSCFTGNMSQFMENFNYTTANELRSFRFKNIFVMEEGASSWTAISSAELSTEASPTNKKGQYAFGSDGETLWGITNGTGPAFNSLPHGPICKQYSFSSTDVPEMPEYDTDSYGADVYTIATALNPEYVLYAGYGTASGGYKNVALWQDYAGADKHELFKFVKYQNKWEIINVGTGELLTAGGTGMNGSTVYTKQLYGEPIYTQLWNIISEDDGSFLIKSASSYNTYLDVTNAIAANGTDVQVFYRNTGYRAQNWYIR